MISDERKSPKRARLVLLLGSMIGLQAVWLGAKYLFAHGGSVSGLMLSAPETDPFSLSPSVLLLFVIGTGSILLLPKTFLEGLSRGEEVLGRFPQRTILLLGAVALLVAFTPTITFPFEGDEKAIYDAGRLLSEGGWSDFWTGYPHAGIGDRHPPLAALLAGTGQAVFGDHPIAVRFLFLSFLAGSTALTFAVGAKLYDRKTGFRAALLYLGLRMILFMGVRVSTDLPVTFFALGAVYFMLELAELPTVGKSIGLGGALGLGLLSKYTMGMIYPFIGCVAARKRSFLVWSRTAGAVGLSAVLLGGWLGWMYASGAFAEQAQTIADHAGTSASTSPLSGWRLQYRLEALIIHLPSALGAYVLPVLMLGGWRVLSKRRGEDFFLIAWIVTVSGLLMLTLPVERYFIPVFPALAIAGAVELRGWGEARWQVILLALLYSLGTALLYT